MSKIKRLTAFVLLFITITFNVAVAEVQAETVQNEAITDVLIAVGAVIGTETALAYALGVLGFTAASVAVYENRDSLIDWCEDVKEDFIEFCAKTDKWVDVTGAKIQNWLEGIGMGVLDKADETWLALKDFCVDIFNKQQAGDIDSSIGQMIEFGDLYEYTRQAYLKQTFSYEKINFVERDDYAGLVSTHTFSSRLAGFAGDYQKEVSPGQFESFPTQFHIGNDTEIFCFCVTSETLVSDIYYLVEFSTATFQEDFNCDEFRFYPFSFVESNGNLDSWNSYLWKNYFFNNSYGHSYMLNRLYFNDRMPASLSEGWKTYKLENLYGKFVSDNDYLNTFFVYLATCLYHNIAIPGLDLPLDDGITEEQTAGYVVDGSVGDVIERDGTLDYVDIINPRDIENEKVEVDVDGIGIEDIANPFPDSRVWTIDAAVDIVLPDGEPVSRPEEGEDSDVDDFTLEGLEKVFPFCVPWDIKSIFETLSTDAKAPKFQWEFTYYDSKGKKKEKVEIDLSIFDNVALVFRTMELLAFIVGLLLLTRNSIMSR